MSRILIVEDDPAIQELVQMNFTVVGHVCTAVSDGAEALRLLCRQEFDLALLDIMLPGLDGFELIPHMQQKHLPVIFVSAKNTTADKVKGLQLGAEDYLVKPFDILELIVRAEKVLARIKGGGVPVITAGEVMFDIQSHLACREGQTVDLTPVEYRLALLFAQHPGMVFSREQLLREVWGDAFFGETRTVDVHVASLRKKLSWQNHLVTVHRIGYRMTVEL